MKTHFHRMAFKKMGSSLKFSFDEQAIKLRRNLMLSSSVLIIMCMVQPLESSGSYEVNIGIIKGSLTQPWLVYGMLLTATLYYLIYFVTHLRKMVVDGFESDFAESTFFFFLSECHANHAVREFWADENGTYMNPPSITFTMAGGGSESIYPSNSTQPSTAISNEKHAMIDDDQKFSIKKYGDRFEMQYFFEPNQEDFVAFHQYKDSFIRYRVFDWFTSTLPIYYGIVSIILGLLKSLYVSNILQ